MKNEKGFIFPLTLIVTFITFFVIISSVQIYLSETRYFHETKGYYVRNSMMSLAMKTLIKHIENQNIKDQGMISFEEGNVLYRTEPLDSDRYRIILVTNMSFGQETKNEVIYDQKQKRIMKWVEN